MSAPDLAMLVFLAAIWGASFTFLRIAVPEVGPMFTAILRITLAATVLFSFARLTGVTMAWRRNLVPYAAVGVCAATVPFVCFAYAAPYLPAAYLAVLNSTGPLFGALFASLWLAERLTIRKFVGLLLGVVGVSVLVGAGTIPLTVNSLIAVAACLLAAASYALSSIIVKKIGHYDGAHRGIEPIALATGSMVFGGMVIAPLAPFSLPAAMPSALALWCVAGTAILSSGLAQVLFIPMIVRIGPTRAMSASFLIPLFSMLWAYVFLHEPVKASTLIGAGIVLGAMGLVLSASRITPAEALKVDN